MCVYCMCTSNPGTSSLFEMGVRFPVPCPLIGLAGAGTGLIVYSETVSNLIVGNNFQRKGLVFV